MDSKIELVCIPFPPNAKGPPGLGAVVDSNVMMLPTRDVVLLSSPVLLLLLLLFLAGIMPDGPVMDDVALCTVGVLLSAPKLLSIDDMCSNMRFSASSFDVVRVGRSGGGEEDAIEGRALMNCALMDGTVFDGSGRNESGVGLVEDGLK